MAAGGAAAAEKKFVRLEGDDGGREALFRIEGEGHTLGNPLCVLLRRVPGVTFAAYAIPHPQDTHIEVRVITDGRISAARALRKACDALATGLQGMRDSFRAQVAAMQAAGEAGN